MQLMNINQSATMSSREIAQLVEKQHGNIKISAERLAEKGVIALQETPYTDPQNKQTYIEYLFSKRDSLILVAQNCPEFTARLVDRWQELESKQKPATAELSRMDILKIAMAAEEENQQLRLEVATQAHRLDESAKWASIKRMESAYNLKFKFSELKRYSLANGYKMPKVADSNYPAGVNTYHEDVWMEVYGVDILPQSGVI